MCRAILRIGQVGLGQVSKEKGTTSVEVETDRRTTVVVQLSTGLREVIARHSLVRKFLFDQKLKDFHILSFRVWQRHHARANVAAGVLFLAFGGISPSGNDTFFDKQLTLVFRERLGGFDQIRMIDTVRENAELKTAETSDLRLHLLDQIAIDTGDNDFDPVGTNTPDGHVDRSRRIHALLDRIDHLADGGFVDELFLCLGFFRVNLIDQIRSPREVNSEVQGIRPTLPSQHFKGEWRQRHADRHQHHSNAMREIRQTQQPGDQFSHQKWNSHHEGKHGENQGFAAHPC